jgi:hypothetical protein
MSPDIAAPLRELDHRVIDGISVLLLWRPHDERVFVAVDDAKTGESFTIEVGEDRRALDVFHHPFAYAADAPAAAAMTQPLARTTR